MWLKNRSRVLKLKLSGDRSPDAFRIQANNPYDDNNRSIGAMQ